MTIYICNQSDWVITGFLWRLTVGDPDRRPARDEWIAPSGSLNPENALKYDPAIFVGRRHAVNGDREFYVSLVAIRGQEQGRSKQWFSVQPNSLVEEERWLLLPRDFSPT